MVFERFICRPGNSSKFRVNQCFIKKVGHIGTDRVNVSVKVSILKPVSELHAHLVVYFKYQVFKKFPIDIWEDICGWSTGKKKSFLMDWSIGKYMDAVKYDSGEKFQCPMMVGNLSVNFHNISFNEHFPFAPLMPSGHYRFDITTTEGQKSILMAYFQLFISIADNRIEQY